jgi:hypothetical protein
MTAITTLISLAPMIIQKPSLAGTYYYSIGIVIVGGLALSTFLTSVLLPTNATIVEDFFSWLGRALRWVGRFVERVVLRRRSREVVGG